jgi:hypothetical protein
MDQPRAETSWGGRYAVVLAASLLTVGLSTGAVADPLTGDLTENQLNAIKSARRRVVAPPVHMIRLTQQREDHAFTRALGACLGPDDPAAENDLSRLRAHGWGLQWALLAFAMPLGLDARKRQITLWVRSTCNPHVAREFCR